VYYRPLEPNQPSCGPLLPPNPIYHCTTNFWEVTRDYWRLLTITGDYWRLLKITDKYWRLLKITGALSLLEITANNLWVCCVGIPTVAEIYCGKCRTFSVCFQKTPLVGNSCSTQNKVQVPMWTGFHSNASLHRNDPSTLMSKHLYKV